MHPSVQGSSFSRKTPSNGDDRQDTGFFSYVDRFVPSILRPSSWRNSTSAATPNPKQTIEMAPTKIAEQPPSTKKTVPAMQSSFGVKPKDDVKRKAAEIEVKALFDALKERLLKPETDCIVPRSASEDEKSVPRLFDVEACIPPFPAWTQCSDTKQLAANRRAIRIPLADAAFPALEFGRVSCKRCLRFVQGTLAVAKRPFSTAPLKPMPFENAKKILASQSYSCFECYLARHIPKFNSKLRLSAFFQMLPALANENELGAFDGQSIQEMQRTTELNMTLRAVSLFNEGGVLMRSKFYYPVLRNGVLQLHYAYFREIVLNFGVYEDIFAGVTRIFNDLATKVDSEQLLYFIHETQNAMKPENVLFGGFMEFLHNCFANCIAQHNFIFGSFVTFLVRYMAQKKRLNAAYEYEEDAQFVERLQVPNVDALKKMIGTPKDDGDGEVTRVVQHVIKVLEKRAENEKIPN